MGEKPPYLAEYRHNGVTYSLPPIWAESWEDAQARLRSIGATGKVIGSDVTSVPVNSVTLPFVHLFAAGWRWIANLFRSDRP